MPFGNDQFPWVALTPRTICWVHDTSGLLISQNIPAVFRIMDNLIDLLTATGTNLDTQTLCISSEQKIWNTAEERYTWINTLILQRFWNTSWLGSFILWSIFWDIPKIHKYDGIKWRVLTRKYINRMTDGQKSKCEKNCGCFRFFKNIKYYRSAIQNKCNCSADSFIVLWYFSLMYILASCSTIQIGYDMVYTSTWNATHLRPEWIQ